MLLAMVRLLALAFVLSLGCSDGSPYCGLPEDLTGRLVVYCDSPRDEAVCDLPGEEAHYEMGATGLYLAGGLRAGCDIDDEISCPLGTVGEAYCITDPEL